MRNYCTPEDFDATTIDNCFESSCFHSCCGRRGPRGFVVLPGLPVQQVQPEQRELPDNVVVAVLP